MAEIVQDICQGNWLRFGTGKLKELCKLLPEEGEVMKALLFSCFCFGQYVKGQVSSWAIFRYYASLSERGNVDLKLFAIVLEEYVHYCKYRLINHAS